MCQDPGTSPAKTTTSSGLAVNTLNTLSKISKPTTVMSNPQLDNKILELQAKLKEVEELNADLVKEVQDVNVLNLKKIAEEYIKLAAKYQAAEEFINFIVTQQVTSQIKITGGAGYVFRKAVVSVNKPLKEQVKARKTAYKNYLKKLAAIEKLKSKPT